MHCRDEGKDQIMTKLKKNLVVEWVGIVWLSVDWYPSRGRVGLETEKRVGRW